jgi:hypothetical protein
MKTKWFKRFGWFYLPVSVPGAFANLIAVLFCFTVFRAIDRHSHSVSDTLYGIFPFFVCTFLLLDWLGRKTSDDAASGA